MKRKYDMVFCDLDGTLLDHTHRQIPQINQRAIQRAIEAGVIFVICTGRGVFGVENHLRTLGLLGKEGCVICQNGSTIYQTKTMEPLVLHSFSAADFAPVARLIHQHQLGLQMYYDRDFLGETETPRIKEYCNIMGVSLHKIDALHYDGKFSKCLADGPREKLEILRREVANLTDQFDMYYSGSNYLEFVPKGVHKGKALEDVANRFGVPLSRTLAIGDSENDCFMLEKAGFAVAMVNGEDGTKAVADYVTVHNYDEGGVAEAMEKFLYLE